MSMSNETSKFTLRTEAELLKKFKIVADYNGRSSNRELEVIIKRHVSDFEKQHGIIQID